MLTVAIAFGFGAVAQSQTFSETFEAGTPLPATNFFIHDGISTATQADSLTAEGIPDFGAFAGAGGGSAGSAAATLGLSANGGVGGSQAASLTLTNDGTTTFAFAGAAQPVGFPLTVPTDFTVSADVLAPVGFPFSIRIESPFGPTNNGFELNFVGTGQFETISGVVGTDLTPIQGGTFDNSVDSIFVLASTFSGLPIGVDQEVLIDNLSVAPTNPGVPEPSSIAILLSLSSIIAVRRRRT